MKNSGLNHQKLVVKNGYLSTNIQSLTNKKCGCVENRMVINSCGMMGLVTWFK
jgi:hypothetical protein